MLVNRPGGVTVHFIDANTSQEQPMDAELVIGADGVNSTVRRLLNAPVAQKYAGYIVLRGTLPATSVSAETLQPFSNRLVFNFLRPTYFVCYVIPPENGSTDPNHRLLNWVWYYNVADKSDGIGVFTDMILPRISPPLRELLQKPPNLFVTKIRDSMCTRTSFYHDKILLVSDAFTTLRPHTGAATEQAAYHSNTLETVDLSSDTTWIGL
ncbi:hypothetical protein F4802DRAFT_595358 [Xylaria palmicola]|nr:hypothetical protein F4802DRAFT_595358 [Xylaria palmicola]